MYTIRYKTMRADEIEDVVVVLNPGYGKPLTVGSMQCGTRPLPNYKDPKSLDGKNGFFTKLEQSVLEEGFRNPVLIYATESGNYVYYGATRTVVAKKHNLALPCVIADYAGKHTDGEELQTRDDIVSKFKDPPSHVVIKPDQLNIWGCNHTHLDECITGPADSTSLDEKRKYEKMWLRPEYRAASPSYEHLPVFLERVKPEGVIVDYGCGTGKAALRLRRMGFKVKLVDIASNAVDPAVKNEFGKGFEFIETSLWNMLVEGDYGFCCDVLEHIPPAKVGATLKNIRKGIKRKVFVTVSMIDDSLGKLIGEKLHLTVRDSSWWFEQFAKAGLTVLSHSPITAKSINFWAILGV